MSEVKGGGLRHNKGKVRFDLMHPVGTMGLARVITKGTVKYADRNWELGMSWSTVIASAYRHLQAVMRGEDYDYDPNCEDCKKGTVVGDINDWHCKVHTGERHIDLLQTNAHFLSSYYKIYPQGDDRVQPFLNRNKIGLDIDEVLCDFTLGWSKLHKVERNPYNWNYHRKMGQEFAAMKKKGTLNKFYLGLQPKINPNDIPFEPHCYITSRIVPNHITEQWLDKHKFPVAPVITVGFNESKVEVIKKSGIDIFVDDRFENFADINKAGVCCYLFDAPHNQRYDVGHKRIKSLKELI